MASGQQMLSDKQLYLLIESRTGLVLNEHQRADIASVLDSLPTSPDGNPFDDPRTLLAETPVTHPLWQRLVQSITVGETYFFRNQAQFDVLRSEILPTLINERRKMGSKQLRLWSAGSASGEEPYSLAILLRELLPDIESWNIAILATDINAGYLERARQGVYRAHSFRNETPKDLRERWFVEEKDGYRLKASIRSMVVFESLNLVSDDYPAFENSTMYMDVILCRNVTIYFDRETTRLIARRFHKALNQNGWLVVGHSEPQADIYQGFVARNFKDTVLYQKESSETPQESVALPAAIVPDRVPLPVYTSPQKRKNVPAVKIANPISQNSPETDFWMQAKQAADLGRRAEALQWLDKAERRDQLRPEVHYLRALVELDAGHDAQAIQLLRRAIYCDPNFVLAHYTLGDVYHRRAAPKEAARHWQLALDAVENRELQEIVPYSDDLTVEMLIQLMATRLSIK